MEPRAAIGDFDQIERRLHALHHKPEPARDPPADGRLRAAHPRASAPRGGTRRGRRVRLEDLPLRRGGDRHLGRRQGEAPREVDGRAGRELHDGRARPRPREHRRDGARRGRQLPRLARQYALQHGRLSFHLRDQRADLSVRHLAGRRLQDAGDLRRGEGGVHQHRSRGRLSRGGPAGGDVPARTPDGRDRPRYGARPRGTAPAQLHPHQRLPVSDAGGVAVRQRRLLLHPGFRAKGGRRRRVRGRRKAAAARGKLRGLGYLHLRGSVRHRALGRGGVARRARRALRGGQHPRASDRQRHRVYRHP